MTTREQSLVAPLVSRGLALRVASKRCSPLVNFGLGWERPAGSRTMNEATVGAGCLTTSCQTRRLWQRCDYVSA